MLKKFKSFFRADERITYYDLVINLNDISTIYHRYSADLEKECINVIMRGGTGYLIPDAELNDFFPNIGNCSSQNGDKPQRVKIGGLFYTVEYVPRLLSQDDVTKLNGHILYNPCLIRVEAENDEQIQGVTILHEILHGILLQAGRNEEHQEKDIEILAYGLFDVLRGNPDMVDWLRNIEKDVRQ